MSSLTSSTSSRNRLEYKSALLEIAEKALERRNLEEASEAIQEFMEAQIEDLQREILRGLREIKEYLLRLKRTIEGRSESSVAIGLEWLMYPRRPRKWIEVRASMEKAETMRLLENWRELPEEAKVKVVKEILSYFRKRAEENPFEAFIEFVGWLASDEGAIIWPWIWKDEYRQIMIDVATAFLKLFSRLPLAFSS